MPPRAEARLRTRDAVALGLLHGPAELLPISSSAHVALVPWLLGWPYDDLDADQRKAFEVALHAGTVAALLLGLRAEVAAELRALDLGGVRRLAISTFAARRSRASPSSARSSNAWAGRGASPPASPQAPSRWRRPTSRAR